MVVFEDFEHAVGRFQEGAVAVNIIAGRVLDQTIAWQVKSQKSFRNRSDV
jgi:hypothetical protein